MYIAHGFRHCRLFRIPSSGMSPWNGATAANLRPGQGHSMDDDTPAASAKPLPPRRPTLPPARMRRQTRSHNSDRSDVGMGLRGRRQQYFSRCFQPRLARHSELSAAMSRLLPPLRTRPFSSAISANCTVSHTGPVSALHVITITPVSHRHKYTPYSLNSSWPEHPDYCRGHGTAPSHRKTMTLMIVSAVS
ncbi:hypothetical protein BDZ89DRAFT_467256 [Hymenopellis radicata]|nr:hypothetical protein BDZ89DRAFT_467256 [Hymenopellis radicata]